MNTWSRDDLPSVDDCVNFALVSGKKERRIADDVLYYAVDRLNAHHPKPEQTMVPARPVSPEERGELWARIRDELRGVYSSTTDQDHRKLDLAASASADTAVEYLNDRGGLGIDAREPLERALRERDAAVERAEQAERAVNKWRTSTESAHSDFLQAAHERDEWKARAEQAESELKPSSPLRQQADSWMRIVNHPAISQALSEKNKSYSDQVFERITWLFEAAEDARESNPAPAVTRADIEKALRECTNEVFASHAYPHMADAVCALFGIEAEQAVDPVEAKAREWAQIMWPEVRLPEGDGAVGALCRLIRHLDGQEATDDV